MYRQKHALSGLLGKDEELNEGLFFRFQGSIIKNIVVIESNIHSVYKRQQALNEVFNVIIINHTHNFIL